MRATLVRRRTGLALEDGLLEVWYDGDHTPETKSRPGLRNHWQIWVGRRPDGRRHRAGGRQIAFVDPARAGELDVAETTADLPPRFLTSPTYRRLTG